MLELATAAIAAAEQAEEFSPVAGQLRVLAGADVSG
jgi:hypothetical protein